MENTTHREVATVLVEKLFAAPGSFAITMAKEGDEVKILAGRPKDFLTLQEVAKEFGVTTQTIRRRYLNKGELVRTRHGFRRSDVNRIKLREAQ